MPFPPCPKEIKPVAHLLKIAEEHESRNIVVAYWARFSAVNLALKLLPGKKPPEVSALLASLLDWLEQTKKEQADNDGITNEAAAQALIEEYALTLFNHGDQQDKAGIFNKNTVKTFYTAGMLMDILEQFGLSEEIGAKRKYAKWKAAQIHNCLKSGTIPTSGDPNNPSSDISSENALTDEERKLVGDDYMNKHRENTVKDEEDDILYIPTVPKPNENNFAPAPASSPVTPGVTVPQVPLAPATSSNQPPRQLLPTASGIVLTPYQIQKAQKFCKYATSALNYDDTKTAIDNLYKALNLLQSGIEE